MFSFFLTFARLFKGIYRSWQNPTFRSTLFLAILILLSGTLFYHAVEGGSWIDSAYFSVMLATTVGLGDLAPSADGSKLFTMVYAITSIGVFIALITQLASSLIAPRQEKGESPNEAPKEERSR
ncbi:MAG: transporter [Rhodobacterales bacterium]|nr:MAG: transporter [Rhodobacterales bacterium]